MSTGRATDRGGIRESVFERDEYTCQHCGDRYDEPYRLNAVLKTPIAEGGADSVANRETRCDRCASLRDVPSATDADDLDSQLVQGLKAIDKATTVQSFADDALDVVKIGLAIPSIPIAAIALGVNAQAVTDVAVFANRFVWLGVTCWMASLLISGRAYYTARTSPASPTVVEAVVDEDGVTDAGEPVAAETVASYRRNARLIAAGILSLALAVGLFGVGVLAGLGLFQ